jgi:hypothetical protein
MASWTDSTPVFNPYIQQVPVDKMLAVGMQKQQQYDQGIQRIQSEIDRVAGLDVYRDQDRQHLQSKLNDLGSKLRTVAAGDFSNFQLVNSVAGMAGKVAKDPIVLAAVQSTANIRKNNQIMEEARQKGELTPDNEFNYSKKLNSYINTGLTDDSGKPITFSGKYISHFDVFKYAKETFDAVKPDGMTWDQVYETDDSGNPLIDKSTGKPIYSPVMIRMEKEGRFPQKVKETLDQIFSDPKVSQQLQITGEYNYRNFDSNLLKEKLILQQNEVVSSIGDRIKNFSLNKNLATTEEEKNAIDAQIQSMQNSIIKTKDNYAKLFEIADSNPDAVRGMSYMDDIKNRYSTMFGYEVTKKSTMANPGWDANFKLENEIWNRKMESAKFNQSIREFESNQQYKAAELALKEKELAMKANKLSPVPDTELANQSSNFDKLSYLGENYNVASDNYNDASNGFIWKAYYSDLPGVNDRYKKLLATNNNSSEVIDTIIKQDAEAAGKSVAEYKVSLEQEATRRINEKGSGNIQSDLADAMASYNSTKTTFQDWKAIKDQVDNVTSEKINQTIGKLMFGDEIKPQTIDFRGQKVNLSKQDIIDLGVYIRGYKHVWGFAIDEGARKMAKSAEERLRNSGKSDIVNYFLRNAMADVSPVTKVIRTIGSPIQSIVDDWSRLTGGTKFDFNQIEKVYDAINNNVYTEGLKEQGDVLDRYLTIKPNLKSGIFTGKAEDDRAILMDLKRVMSGYGDAGNISPDFQNFKNVLSGITDAKDITAGAVVKPVAGGMPQIEIVLYEAGKRSGGMTVQQDEASRFIDVSNVYTPDEILSAENFTIMNGGSTSNGSADNYGTYLSGDARFQKIKGDFPLLQNLSEYDVMANIVNSNGGSYGKVFVHDTKTGNKYIETTPKGDFATVYNTLKSMQPVHIMTIVNAGKK